MNTFMLIRHTVEDFAYWKAGYDAHAPMRQAAGLTEKHLLRDADDPNSVVVMFEASDLSQAKAFAASDDLRERMRDLGVIGRPDVYFLKS